MNLKLDEIEKFLGKHTLAKLTQEVKNANTTISHYRNGIFIKNILTKKTLGPDGFTSELYNYFTNYTNY